MKIESAKVTWQTGSSSCAETGPLFPPLHVSEMGAKSSIRAPPRNKMALFEQFTIPFNRNVPSHEVGLRNPSPKQHGANESHFDHLKYDVPATLASTNTMDCEVGTNIKSSYGSSIGSLSTCSAIVNTDVSQRVQMPEPAEDTAPLCRVTHKKLRSHEKVSKDTSKDVNEKLAVDHSRACVQPAGVTLESFHKQEDSTARETFDAKIINIMKHSRQEVTNCCDGLASAGSQLSGPEMGESENNMNTDVLNSLHNEGSNQLKSVNCHPSLGSSAVPHQQPVVIGQDDSPCTAGVVHVRTPIAIVSLCEKTNPEIVIPFSTSIKPKHVIDAVGQRLFWKARKAILRQQEIFSNQVFELHKLTKVQKLLAKMSGPLIDECTLLGGVSDKLGCDHLPTEGGPSEQENLSDRRARAPAPQKSGSHQQARKKQQRNFVPCEESEVEKIRGGIVPDTSYPRVLTNAPFGEPCRSSSADGVSAWGYPMGPLNRPVMYPSGSNSLPSGSPFNGAYVVGPAPPMAPFAFPCYGQRPEPSSAACPNNQWPSAMYYNPFLTPVVNDWFAMNYQGRVSLASGSEKAAPTSSVPSINMKADVSTHSVQPAAFSCVPPQLGSSRLIATRSLGSHATASVSTPPNAILKRPSAGIVREQRGGPSRGSSSGCVVSEGGGTHEGEKMVAEAEAHGWSRNVAGEQLPMSYEQRAGRMNVDSFLGGNALNLFPLQPSSSSGGYSEGGISRQADCQGRVIKAVPRSALAASESAAGILLSIQRERQL